MLENTISRMHWPPGSPDLNPIKNIGKLFKEEINKAYPDL